MKRKHLKITFIALLLLLMSSSLLDASTHLEYDPPLTYPTATDPRGLTSGDFNGDSFSDLATANSASNNISVFINNGNGTFSEKTDYPSGGDSYGITNADFNGDGSLDLAVANYTNAEIAVLLGGGDGTFASPVTYTAGAGARHLLAVDLDGDGNTDLACANYNANTMSVFIGVGDGTFEPKTDYITGDLPRMLASGDFDSDGIIDLLALNNLGHSFSLFTGVGDGTLQYEGDITLNYEPAPRSIAAGDFDGDGNLDVVTANVWTSDISILFGNGNGTFTPEINYEITIPNTIVVGDFSGDGIDDIALTGSDMDDPNILLLAFCISNGDRTFTRDSDIDFTELWRPFWMVSDDFNNDGFPDLSMSHQDEIISVFLRHNDTTPPVVSFSPGVLPDGSYAKGTVSIPVEASDNDSGMKNISLFEGENIIETVATSSYSFSVDTTTLLDGEHTFRATAYDNKDNSSSVERTYIADNTKPTTTSFSAPTVSTSVSSTESFSLSWSGEDSTSGVSGYRLMYHPHTTTAWRTLKIDGSYWTTKKNTRFTGKAGYTYYFKVRAKDSAGNIGNFSTVKSTVIPYDHTILNYSGNWKTTSYNSKQYLGYSKYSLTKGDYAQKKFSSGVRQIYVIATKRSNGGKIDIYLNGIKQKTIDLYSSSTVYRKIIWSKAVDKSAANTLKIVTAGTKNSLSSGIRVEIDGVAIKR